MDLPRTFHTVADRAAAILGRPSAFLFACLYVLVWLGSGPLFGWSERWQLVAENVTSLVTFLMVFVLQNSEQRDSTALQAKIDEMLSVVAPAKRPDRHRGPDAGGDRRDQGAPPSAANRAGSRRSRTRALSATERNKF